MYLNECLLLGTLTREPEARQTDAGKACVTAALKLEEPGEERTFTTFVPLVAYAWAAEALRDFEEGTTVLVKGKLGWRSWQQEGQKRGRLEVTCFSVQRIPSEVAF